MNARISWLCSPGGAHFGGCTCPRRRPRSGRLCFAKERQQLTWRVRGRARKVSARSRVLALNAQEGRGAELPHAALSTTGRYVRDMADGLREATRVLELASPLVTAT